MPNKLAHFAIGAENVDRARAFYEAVFGWQFEPWGPPDFYLIQGAGVHGALQQRGATTRHGSYGFDCSFAVDDLDDAARRIVQASGKMLGKPHSIETVGKLARFADTEGNEAFIIQYEPAQRESMGL